MRKLFFAIGVTAALVASPTAFTRVVHHPIHHDGHMNPYAPSHSLPLHCDPPPTGCPFNG